MSTKIYYGMRSDKSLVELYNELTAFRKEHILDNENVRWVDPTKYYSTDNFERIQALKMKREYMDESSLILMPVDNRVLIYPYFCEYMLVGFGFNYEKMCDYLTANTSLYDYGYWDNTDMPDDVTEEEWAVREYEWSLCVGYKPMKYYGMSFLLCCDTDFIKI